MKKVIGIWIDKRTAKIVSITGNAEELYTVESKMEEYHVKGGSGTRSKGGPQDVVQDSKYLERENNQFSDFFTAVIEHLKGADSLVIFGPAQAGKKLHDELSKSYPELLKKVSGLENADSMTDNQVKAWVRNYFAE